MSLLIAGYTPFSTVDYPGHTAAVVFTQGCPWRCRYCQNASLQPLEAPQGAPAWGEFLEWLEGRRGLLDAVVFSGGEPTAQDSHLLEAMADIHQRGTRVGLHTNGWFHEVVDCAASLGMLDWVGLDIKAPNYMYEHVTGSADSWDGPFKSLQALKRSRAPFEVRTTYHPAILAEHELLGLAQELATDGPLDWVIQRFQPNSPDPELNATGPAVVSGELLEKLRSVAPNLNISVR